MDSIGKSVEGFEDIFVKIENFIDMVIKDQISWKTLSIILDEMTKTFAESKQMVKILIQILQAKLLGNLRETSSKETQTDIVQEQENQFENHLNTENSTNTDTDTIEMNENITNNDKFSDNDDKPQENESLDTDLASENVETESNIDQDFTENFNKISQTDLTDFNVKESDNFKNESKEEVLESDFVSECGESKNNLEQSLIENSIEDSQEVFNDLMKPIKINESNQDSNQKLESENIELRFTCEVCSKICSRPCDLKIHIKRYHPDQIHLIEAIPVIVPDLSCHICEVKFTRNYSLQRHIKAHHSETKLKLIKCENCDVKFARLSSLRQHAKKFHPFSIVEKPKEPKKNEFE